MAQGEDGKELAPSVVRTGLVNAPWFREEEMGTGQRTELAWAAEVVDGRPKARPKYPL